MQRGQVQWRKKVSFCFLKKKSSKYNHQSFNKRVCDIDKIKTCLIEGIHLFAPLTCT